MMAVEMRDVAKGYRGPHGQARVFEHLDAAFPRGASVGILGARGAGKSTLIRLIGGSTLPDRGRIRRHGAISPPVATTQAYHAALTGRENLHFVARVNGFDGEAAADFVARFAQLEEAIDQPLQSYTRDRRARFLFAASYALPFDIYLADEVLFGGAGAFRARCVELVQARRMQASFIFTSRSPQMLRRFADIGAVLHEGRLHMFERIGDAIRLFRTLDASAAAEPDDALEDEDSEAERLIDEPFGPPA
ncbi:capsular polysaccharide transport system ATP-binding protein [Angulomicrobium tetraedrale]|uniref:Capsular polysaccharide transport system ATP-binding protein n=1 Tax=Ancylobacter tetraedralis TaxID=217068 RepID=A0A839ZFQ2_9HYPH|nr:ATP-binding cassette domain-containing protein [Ancylobacter tetraedralis]MBB3773691.1 capsular polysaccharide transport system ATP-binding protein [Ancylobacter tetraedralis]